MKKLNEDWVATYSGLFILICAIIATAIFGKIPKIPSIKFSNVWLSEPVVLALIVGLIISNLAKVPEWLTKVMRTELFIRIGLVLLGAEILIPTIMKLGIFGMSQAMIVILSVFSFTIWLSRKLGLDDEFGSILGCAVSICGVSAAIAAGGAIKGDQKKISYSISLVLLCAVPMLFLEPMAAKIFNIPAVVAGAWVGGTIDTTAAVVAAGSIMGKEAMETAAIVKMSQNIFIGVAAFFLALWFSLKNKAQKTSISEIWNRFPKFVIGFVLASLIFSFAISSSLSKDTLGFVKSLRSWLFILAFLGIGLETKFNELIRMGRGKPAIVFFSAQTFNIFLTLAIAYLFFG